MTEIIHHPLRKLINGTPVSVLTNDSSYRGDVIVLIHPYNYETFNTEKRPDVIDYENHLKHMLKEEQRPIITLEREQDFIQTIKRHQSFQAVGERYFAETSQQSSNPLMGWDHLTEYLKSFFPDTIYLCGCFLTKDKQSACVGEAYKQLRPLIPNIALLESCCLSP